MALAQGSRHRLAFVPEVTYGTTPGTPSMLLFRTTGNTLQLSKETYQSEELRSDRGIYDFRHGTKQTGGNLNFELSYGAFDAWLESALMSTWATNVLKTGVVPKSFTVERGFLDIAQYHRFTGVAVNTMSLTIPPSGMVTGSFGVIGAGFATSGTALGTPTDVATNAPFAAVGGSLTEGGSAIALVTGLEINLSNGVAANFAVGSDESVALIAGRSNITGTLTAYFETSALLDKFIDETESSLAVTVADDAGNEIEIELPRIKYAGGAVPVENEGAIILNMPFQALHDVSDASNIIITRTPAP